MNKYMKYPLCNKKAEFGSLERGIPFRQKGQMLVELMITIGIAAILFPALLTGFVTSRQGKPEQIQRMQALTELKEMEEAVRGIRNQDWTTFANLSGTGNLYPVNSGSTWTTTSGIQPINGVYRHFVVSDVNRNSGAIVPTPTGAPDASTKRVDFTVTWNTPYSGSLTSTMYFTRTTNLTQTDTTVSTSNLTTDFNRTGSIFTNTAPYATAGTSIANDGEVDLGAGGGGGDWCKPTNPVFAQYNTLHSGVPIAISATVAATQNLAYLTTGDNASGYVVDQVQVSQTTPPITPAFSDPNAYNSSGEKGYGIYNDGTNVYYAGVKSTVGILKASDLSTAGSYNVKDNGNRILTGTSVYTWLNTGFVTVANGLYKFTISSALGGGASCKNNPNTCSSATLAGNGKRVFVVGSHAYVATDSTTSQLQIIDTNTMGIVQSVNVGNGNGAVDVYVDSSESYAYVVTSYSAGKNDFFIVDLKNNYKVYGYSTYQTTPTIGSMNPKGVAVVSGNIAIVVGCNGGSGCVASGGPSYQVFNVASASASFYCGGITPTGTNSVNSVSPVSQGGNAYAYILTDNASDELQIILGGNGASFPGVGVPGTFESAPFDPGYSTAYNRFVADVNQPGLGTTSIKLQVGVTAPSGGSCPTTSSSYTYLGPDGTSGTYYTPVGGIISGLIPITTSSNYSNPNRCFRYKSWLSTTDQTQGPSLYDMTVNYSP